MRYKLAKFLYDGDPVEEAFWAYKCQNHTDTILSENVDELTLDELVKLCDENAESGNQHHLVGAHKALAEILVRYVRTETARYVLREIALFGGLHDLAKSLSASEIGTEAEN